MAQQKSEQRAEQNSKPRRKKLKFLRQNWHALKRLRKVKWRRPRAVQSKMRQRQKGKAAMPSIGYSMPRNLRSLHPSGFREVMVYNIDNLQKVDAKKEAVRIAAGVSKRKHAAIVEKAKELKIKVLNPR